MKLKSGLRLRSQVCTTELIVIRAPADDVEVTCGGAPLVAVTEQTTASGDPAAGLDGGTVLGKRYTTDTEDGLELLVTKGGRGTLAIGSTPLVFKESKALPASD